MNDFELNLPAQEYFLGLLGELFSKGYFAYKEYLMLGKKLYYAITSVLKNH